MTTDCPLSQRYSKELSQKERRIKKKSKENNHTESDTQQCRNTIKCL